MRYKLEYIGLLMVACLFRMLPRRYALSIGKRAGALSRYVQPARVKIADDNLKHALPELSTNERAKLVQQVFGDMGLGFVEMLRLDMFQGPEDLEKYFQIEGENYLRQAMSHGKGCILLTGHVGFWEAGSFVFPMLGIKVGIVAKVMRNKLVDGYFRRMRQSFGGRVIDSKKGARKIVKALQENHLVGILMDQHTKRSQAISIPFFGRPAYTTPIIAQIAMKYQVPIISAFCYRQPDNKYLIRIKEPFFLEQLPSDNGVEQNTIRLTKEIEKGIMYDPGQWFWVHRRWKQKNDGK